MFSQGGFGPIPESLKDNRVVRASSVADFKKSPKHWKSFHIDKLKEETNAMRLGTIVHMAVLEPEKFAAKYCCDLPVREDHLVTASDIKPILKELGLKLSGTKEEMMLRLIESGDERAALLYDVEQSNHADGKEILKQADWRACVEINNSIAEDAEAKYLLTGGTAEKRGWVLHQETGIIISFQADYFKAFASPWAGFDGMVVDVKKFRDVNPRKFMAAISDSDLHIQGAIYSDAINAITSSRNGFCWVAVDDKAPYLVVPYLLDHAAIEAGQQEYNELLKGLKVCFDSNDWPPPSKGIQPASLSAWKWQQIQEPSEYV